MSKVCQVTGKRPTSGNTVSHANNRRRRRFLPNLHTQRFWLESEKRWVSLKVSGHGLRTSRRRRRGRRQRASRQGREGLNGVAESCATRSARFHAGTATSTRPRRTSGSIRRTRGQEIRPQGTQARDLPEGKISKARGRTGSTRNPLTAGFSFGYAWPDPRQRSQLPCRTSRGREHAPRHPRRRVRSTRGRVVLREPRLRWPWTQGCRRCSRTSIIEVRRRAKYLLIELEA